MQIPAIPVLPKHNGKPEAIQKYSFALRSISDKKISILRIYAEEDMIDIIRIVNLYIKKMFGGRRSG